jgi:hypothetical protein
MMPRVHSGFLANLASRARAKLLEGEPQEQADAKSLQAGTIDQFSIVATMVGNSYSLWSRRGLLSYTHGFASGEPLAGQECYRRSLRPSRIISEGIQDVPDITEAENIWKRSKLGYLQARDLDRIIPSIPWLYDNPTYTPDSTIPMKKIGDNPIFWKPTTPQDRVAPWITPE